MKNVLIKTYTFESGLWYLAKSIGDSLIEKGISVTYVPKSKYILNGRVYRRTYPLPENPSEFSSSNVITFSDKFSAEDLIYKYVVKYNIDTIISFETLMEKSGWIKSIKSKTGVKIIDVPMVEWVTPYHLNNSSYNIFDEIWCLTNLTKRIFDFPNAKKVCFDLVDKSIFYPEDKPNDGTIRFFHAGSLNQHYSSKNTNKVINAFKRFLDSENPNAELTFTGTNNNISFENHTNIKYIDRVLNRNEMGNIYRKSNVVLAPSTREGLGLSLYEAKACNCKLITTDIEPMNEVDADYLCRVDAISNDRGIIPIATVSEEEIFNKIKRVYKDINE
jgi:glycosyltransferase involved in cell wall biosynthesis